MNNMRRMARMGLMVGVAAVFAAGMVVCFLPGCASLAPGADGLVVRAEQAQAGGKATFDLVLSTDNSDRAFFRTNAPGFHNFCEWLRQPQVVNVTNELPRASAMLISLDDVKRDYKASRSNSNALFSAILTLESALNQATIWLTTATNAGPKAEMLKH